MLEHCTTDTSWTAVNNREKKARAEEFFLFVCFRGRVNAALCEVEVWWQSYDDDGEIR